VNLELSRLLAAERFESLREAAQAPPGPLAMLVRRLLRRERKAAVPVAWIARTSRTRELERLAA
jgi:hypothetical protein